jgi:hypothetical protein
MTNIILPDSPSSVLQLLNADKAALERFANTIIQDVKEGRENPLEIQLLIKKYEFVLNEIKENIKVNVNTEVAKYGERPFEYGSAQMHYTPTRTEYDFEVCNDPDWEQYNADVISATGSKKGREEFLKALKEPITMIHHVTGEVVTVTPPQKKQSMGLKVTLK